MPRTFVIKITHGKDDTERAAIGLTVAATAVASDVPVELFLMNDGVFMATPGYLEEMELEHAPPLIGLFNTVKDAGGPIYACTQCMMRRKLTLEDLREGITQAGAPQLVESLSKEGAQSLDF